MVQRTQTPTRVVLIDDHSTLRDLLKAEMPRQLAQRFEVIGEGGNGQEAVDVCLRTKPDLVVFDLTLPGPMPGLEALRQIKQNQPKIKVLIFSGCTQRPIIAQALLLGVEGFVHKAQPLTALFSAMEEVEAGRKCFEPAVAKLGASTPGLAEWQALSAREREVARLIAEGKSTKEAASVLGLSVKTVDKHRTRLMKKLHVHDAVAVTRYAIQAGLVSLN